MNRKWPFFSIIIPTYNRPVQLINCLNALSRLDYPGDRFEVIVVDDSSETPVDTVVASFHNRLDVTLATQLHAGVATARNYGASQSKGEFFAFTDDDCAPASNWLQTLAAHFDRAPYCVVGGRTVNALPSNVYSTTSQLLVNYLYSYYNVDRNKARFFAGSNLAIPAKYFHAMGGFDTTFTGAAEDREFSYRLRNHGYKMIYTPEVLVFHSHVLTFHSFWQQHFNYGRGAFDFRQKCSRCYHECFIMEPLSFYINLVCSPFSLSCSKRKPLLATLLIVSQIANTTGYLWERIKSILKKTL